MPSFLKRAAQRVRRGASHSNGVESAVVDGAASAVSAGATAVDMTAEAATVVATTALGGVGASIMRNQVAPGADPAHEPRPKDDDAEKPFEILWEESGHSQRKSKAVVVTRDTPIDQVVRRLDLPEYFRRKQGWDKGPRGVISILGREDGLDRFLKQEAGSDSLPEGLTAEEATARLRLLFSRGVVQAAMVMNSVCITSGLRVGPVLLAGVANRERNHRMPLLGVASKGCVTWPGDDRPPGKFPREVLQEDHTHFVLLDTDDPDAASAYRFKLTSALLSYVTPEDRAARRIPRAPLPTVVFVLNGGYDVTSEALVCVRNGWPIIAIGGSGGCANLIASYLSQPDKRLSLSGPKLPDPKLYEIVTEGNFEVVELRDSEGHLTRKLIERLFTSLGRANAKGTAMVDSADSIMSCWRIVQTYRLNAQRTLRVGRGTQLAIFYTSVLVTCVVSFQSYYSASIDSDMTLALYLLSVILPISLSVALAVENRFRMTTQSKTLEAASAYLVGEIYKYRTRGVEYGAGISASTADDLLASRTSAIITAVQGSIVGNISALEDCTDISSDQQWFRLSEADDGVSLLTPDEFLKCRVEPAMARCYLEARYNSAVLKWGTIFITVLAGIGTILAFLNFRIFIAITTCVTTGLSALIEHNKFEANLFTFNKTHNELTRVTLWWASLSAIEQANPQKFNSLVRQVERCLLAEADAVFPGVLTVKFDGAKNSSADGAIHIAGLMQDLKESCKDGQILFKKTWVDKHVAFFDQYNSWFEKHNPVKRREIHVAAIEDKDAEEEIVDHGGGVDGEAGGGADGFGVGGSGGGGGAGGCGGLGDRIESLMSAGGLRVGNGVDSVRLSGLLAGAGAGAGAWGGRIEGSANALFGAAASGVAPAAEAVAQAGAGFVRGGLAAAGGAAGGMLLGLGEDLAGRISSGELSLGGLQGALAMPPAVQSWTPRLPGMGGPVTESLEISEQEHLQAKFRPRVRLPSRGFAEPEHASSSDDSDTGADFQARPAPSPAAGAHEQPPPAEEGGWRAPWLPAPWLRSRRRGGAASTPPRAAELRETPERRESRLREVAVRAAEAKAAARRARLSSAAASVAETSVHQTLRSSPSLFPPGAAGPVVEADEGGPSEPLNPREADAAVEGSGAGIEGTDGALGSAPSTGAHAWGELTDNPVYDTASGTSRQPQLPPEQSASLAAHAPSAPGGEEAVASRSAGAQGQAPAASARGLEGIAAWSSVRDNPLLEDAGGERGPGDVVGPSAGVPTAHEAASGAADDYEADLVEPPSNRDVRRSFIQMPDYWAEAEAAGRIPAGGQDIDTLPQSGLAHQMSLTTLSASQQPEPAIEDLRLAVPFEGPLDTKIEGLPIRWDEKSFIGRSSTVLTAVVGTKAKELVPLLDLHKWRWDEKDPKATGYRGVIHIVGNGPGLELFLKQGEGADPLPEGLSKDEASLRLRLLFQLGIVAAARACRAVIVSQGTDSGDVSMLGKANNGWGHAVPIVGVVPKRRVKWPGDSRGNATDRVQLEPNHTHFILVDSRSAGGRDIADTRHFRFDVTCRLAGWAFKKASAKDQVPAVAFLINGGDDEIEEILGFVHRGFPIVVIEGTGGLADKIATRRRDMHAFLADEKIMEICADANLEVMSLSEVDGVVVRQMVQRLFSNRGHVGKRSAASFSPIVAKAWDLCYIYDANARKEARRGRLMRDLILFLGVLATSMAVFTSEISDEENFSRPMGLDTVEKDFYHDYGAVLTCLPILIGILVAVENRFRSVQNYRVLRWASDTIRSEIYRWRANCGDYSSSSVSERNKLLCKRISSVSQDVLSTVVIEGALNDAAARAAAARHYAVMGGSVNQSDNGFDNLTPDDFIQLRVNAELACYKRKAAVAQTALSRLQVAVYALGGVGTLLAAFKFQILVAITIALTTAINTLVEKEAYGEAVHVFNQAAAEVTSILGWWNALSAVEQANPQRYATLVSSVEGVRETVGRFIYPGSSGASEGNTVTVGKTIDLDHLQLDIQDNTLHGRVHFMSTWTNKHRAFFDAYEEWLINKQGVYEKVTSPTGAVPGGPAAGARALVPYSGGGGGAAARS